MTSISLAAVGYRSTEGLQRLQSRIDLITQDIDAPGRSCSSEAASDFQPTDENLNPPLVVLYVTSPTPKYWPDTKPEPAVLVNITESPEGRDKRKDSPQAFTAAPARPTPPRDRKGHKTRHHRQRSTRRPRRRQKSQRCNEPTVAVISAVYIYVKLPFTPGQRYFHSLLQLLEAFAVQLSRRSPCAAPALRVNKSFSKSFTKNLSLQQQRGYELAILTPTEWIEMCQLRRTLREQLRLWQNRTHLPREVAAAAIALGAHQLAAARVDSFSFHLTSEPSQVGMSAWFVSALVHSWLDNVGEH